LKVEKSRNFEVENGGSRCRHDSSLWLGGRDLGKHFFVTHLNFCGQFIKSSKTKH